MYLVQRVEAINHKAVEPEPPCEIKNSYNPTRNTRFYYFQESGNQIRTGQPFSIDGSEKKIHDELPLGQYCKKIFPKVSAKGTTHFFFGLCGLYSHVYGSHMVNDFVSRKDAHFSLYSYLENAPPIYFMTLPVVFTTTV